jgi:STAS-like domain of unknown function (DUF4325)
MDSIKINIAQQFSPFPAGRFTTDGPWSGEKFRDDLLYPAIQDGRPVEIYFDDTFGFGSSFLEEAFGGLIRRRHLSPDRLFSTLQLHSDDPALIEEVQGYIRDAGNE